MQEDFGEVNWWEGNLILDTDFGVPCKRALECDKLGADLVDVAIEWVLEEIILLQIEFVQIKPAQVTGLDQSSKTIDKMEFVAWMDIRGIVERLQIQTMKPVSDLLRSHPVFQYQIASEKKCSICNRCWT
jgi:hypothetical protein